jgi:L-ascorbate metabolism protein UlaG (beta-lactamase superfamily)
MISIYNHDPFNTQHHNGSQGFINTLGEMRDVPLLRYSAWLYRFLLKRKSLVAPTIKTMTTETIVTPPTNVRISFIGHATLLIQNEHANGITDPVLVPRLGPFYWVGIRRSVPLPIDKVKLPPIHYVLLSHDHFEHLDEKSVRWLENTHHPLFIVPLGIKKILSKWKVQKVVELDWWQYITFKNLRISCLPANHWSGRPPARYYQTLWCSWLVQDQRCSVYFAGDSAYARHFKKIVTQLGAPDIAILPIGAYRPKWLHEVFHMNPIQAVQAFLDLQSTYLVPMHWGTFDISEEHLHEPMLLLMKEAEKRNLLGKIRIFNVGDQFEV